MSETSIQAYQGDSAGNGVMTLNQMKAQVQLIQHVMKDVMKKGEHYGVVPGCGDKPTLLKPGSEKIMMIFRMAPEYKVTRYDLPDGHREYEVITTLKHIETGKVVGEGVGCCTTMEGKYRFRTEFTGQPVPGEYWESRDKDLLGGSQYSVKKVKGKWEIVEKVEHDNPADYYNTIMKMAKKRSQSDAVLTATAASDIFTQDIEDMPEVMGSSDVVDTTEAKVANDTKTATEAQQKRLWNLAQNNGWNKDNLKEMVETVFEIDSLSKVMQGMIPALEEYIKNGPPKDETAGGKDDLPI